MLLVYRPHSENHYSAPSRYSQFLLSFFPRVAGTSAENTRFGRLNYVMLQLLNCSLKYFI